MTRWWSPRIDDQTMLVDGRNRRAACELAGVEPTEGYRRFYFGPPLPDGPAASMGDYCSAVLKI